MAAFHVATRGFVGVGVQIQRQLDLHLLYVVAHLINHLVLPLTDPLAFIELLQQFSMLLVQITDFSLVLVMRRLV